MLCESPGLEPFSLPELTAPQYAALAIGAMGIGFSKAGFAGVSMLHVVIYASVFDPKASTGVLLPMLVFGDVCAIGFFGRAANWSQVRRLLPPTLAGVLIGWRLMDRLDEQQFKLVVGGIILILAGLQAFRMRRPEALSALPGHVGFAITLGILAGVTTMLANAAGPVVALYLLAVAMPKWELIGTAAWLFLILNVLKLPLSAEQGLIDAGTLVVDASLVLWIPIGMAAGQWLVGRVPQVAFNWILLGFTVIAAVKMLLP